MIISDNPLAALGPIAWDTLDQHTLSHFLTDTFTCAQILADSIPATTSASASASSSTGGRPRSQTDGAVSYGLHSAPTSHHGSGTATPSLEDMSAKAEKLRQDLRQSWKEVKTGNANTNPRDIVVYKMNGGREGYAGSSWFARRSLHRVEKPKPLAKSKDKKALDMPDVEIGFDMFRKELLKEFSLPEQKKEGEASTVRTMITKKRLEHVVVDGKGHDAVDNEEEATEKEEKEPTEAEKKAAADAISRQLDIYLLEAEFPGPTATRDFVTMLLTTQCPCHTVGHQDSQHGLRQFMLVSKPCEHPETPQRSGYVRAQYESVEVIREVRVPAASKAVRGLASNTRKTRSSIDLSHGDIDTADASDRDNTDGHEIAIEWLMITRNNPGGNVPRFLVDKSTPSSIISDANKFLDWLVAQQVEKTLKEGADKPQEAGVGKPVTATPLTAAIPEEEEEETTGQKAASLNETSDTDFATEDNNENNRSSASPSVTILSLESSGGAASSAKLFNMLSGALGGAGTAVASKLPNPFGGAVETLHSSFEGHHVDDEDEDDDIDTTDDTGNTYSDIDDEDVAGEEKEKTRGRSRRSTQDTKSTADNASVASIPPPPPTTALEMLAHERALALRKLNDGSLTGLSAGGGSSVGGSDIENDTETGSATASSKQQKKVEQHAAANAAKAAKAAEAARKKHEKELQKLQDKQKKAEADILKASKTSEASKTTKDVKPVDVVKEDAGSSAQSTKSAKSAKSAADSITAAAADGSSTSSPPAEVPKELQKLREKHDRAVARQEAQYKKEMEKLEKKRQQQAEKEAARLRKQQERDEKNDAALQLTHARAERDVARKEVEVLTERVRQLEAQNELLAAEVAQSTGQSKLHAKVEDADDEK